MSKFIKGVALVIAALFILPLVAGCIAGMASVVTGDRPSRPAAAAPPPPAPSIGAVGDTLRNGDWMVKLARYGSYDSFRAPGLFWVEPQGVYVVVEVHVRNLTREQSNFRNHDFEIRSPDGRTFKSVPVAIDKAIAVSQSVQPGLTTENRIVFDVDPESTGLHLIALGTDFALPD